jgi:hypothetical protein
LQFLGCLHQFSQDKMLCCEKGADVFGTAEDNPDYLGEDRSPRFWICA